MSGFLNFLRRLFGHAASSGDLTRDLHEAPTPAGTWEVLPDALRPLVDVINATRAAHGCRALEPDGLLMSIADDWADQMAEKGELTHGNFQDRIWSAHPNTAAGENIAQGQANPDSVIQAWLGSPPHRAILFGDFDLVGVGLAKDEKGTNYWVADFDKI